MRKLEDSQSCIELEDRYAAHNYHPLDVVIARAEGAFVWDVEGRRYLDCLSAYSAVNQGHGHPRIVQALIDQARTLALTSRAFHNDRFGPFCEKLSRTLGYPRVLMMNTGAEAVETAIKAARRWGYERKGVPDERARILVFGDNFHGRTTTIVGFSSDEGSRRHFGPFAPGFTSVPFGDLAAVERAFDDEVVAVLVEPIQGEAGVVIPPPGFLRGLRELCTRKRALLICDEIQSGLGRAGHLLAQEASGVRADGVTIGKALSGGLYPVSAFLATEELMGVFTPGSHGSTYGGNPLACAVADAALDVILDEDLCARSLELGAWFLDELRRTPSALIEELRGAGLWFGIQLKPQAGGARRYCERLKERGLLCKETHTHTIRVAPPLVTERSDLEWALAQLREVLAGG
ncbi:MAG: ornithine--oxo-acid transaminase [Planctomycetes bacterium]|nr:ornithine--oxo-acid transaminase [Planctomycetota bacterium]